MEGGENNGEVSPAPRVLDRMPRRKRRARAWDGRAMGISEVRGLHDTPKTRGWGERDVSFR